MDDTGCIEPSNSKEKDCGMWGSGYANMTVDPTYKKRDYTDEAERIREWYRGLRLHGGRRTPRLLWTTVLMTVDIRLLRLARTHAGANRGSRLGSCQRGNYTWVSKTR